MYIYIYTYIYIYIDTHTYAYTHVDMYNDVYYVIQLLSIIVSGALPPHLPGLLRRRPGEEGSSPLYHRDFLRPTLTNG